MSTLSATDRQILSAQSIDAYGPGTVLRDFDTLLDVVGTRGIAVTSRNHRLPLHTLAPLNARMTRPMVVYLVVADNVSRLLPSRLRGVHQPVMSPRNEFSTSHPTQLAYI